VTRTVALTGGTGFIGQAAIDLLLSKRFRVRALARDPAKLARFKDRIEIVPGALDAAAALEALAAGAEALVHCAGLTHARRDAEYSAVNVEGAANAASAAAASGAIFVHLSSIAARAPFISPYAASKAASEKAVSAASGRNRWIALRAPAIYGPRDRATLPYFRLVKAGFAAEPRSTPEARASLVYVEDIARAVVAAIENPPPGGVYEVGDESAEGRTWREIGATLADVLKVKARRIRAPRGLVAGAGGAVRAVEALLGRAPSLRSGQVAEFYFPDWVARENLFSAATGFKPDTPLQEGFAKTVRWYQENGLL
jgi:nucleoside-diphosphate-sugar epimerase